MIFQGTECGRDILRQLRAGGGIDCVGANEMFNGMSTVRFHELSQFSNRASRRCNISFFDVFDVSELAPHHSRHSF
jgi:hypothetical protein